MNSQRVRTVMLHSWYHLNHSMETWMDLYLFPVAQFFVFGLIAFYFIQKGADQGAEVILLGMVYWAVISTAQYSITLSALWEFWSKSFSSLFVSPLTLGEFVVGNMIASVLKSVPLFLLVSGLSFWWFGFSVMELSWWLVFFFIEFVVFGWAMGMFLLGLIFRHGLQVQSLAWGVMALLQPLGAVFYPVSILPQGIRWLAYGLPMTYMFESARGILAGLGADAAMLALGTGFNGVYLLLSIWFLKRMYRKARESGSFVRMEQ